MTNLEKAKKEYLDRQNRDSHPDGSFDKGGRWYPSDAEKCSCCTGLRAPSRAHPYSLMTHCRTKKHVARLFGLEVKDLK